MTPAILTAIGRDPEGEQLVTHIRCASGLFERA